MRLKRHGKKWDSETVKIRFRQSGGVGGLFLGCDLDTETLSKKEAAELVKLVAAAKLKNLTVRNAQGRDLSQYEITVDADGAKSLVQFDDMTIPAGVERLLEFLSSRATAIPLK